MVKQANSADYGQGTGYDLKLFHPTQGTPGWLTGIVVNSLGEGIGNAVVKSDTGNVTTMTQDSGSYMMALPSGTHLIAARASGYGQEIVTGVEILDSEETPLDFELFILADSDNDGTPDNEDGCPDDFYKTEPGVCGCGAVDTDSDGDGIADCNDNYPYDYDNDGMPDEWEDQNGLNSLVDDAEVDNDGDGFSNIQEYNRGTDPQDAESHPSRAMPWLMLLLEE